MAYIVRADLTEVISDVTLLQLTDDDKTGALVEDRTTRAITSAEGVINGYLGVPYVVPIIGAIPDIVQKWAVDIAKYFLYQRRRVPEDVRQSYEDAIAQLRDVSARKMTLGIATIPSSSSLGNQGAVYGPGRVFTRDTLGGY